MRQGSSKGADVQAHIVAEQLPGVEFGFADPLAAQLRDGGLERLSGVVARCARAQVLDDCLEQIGVDLKEVAEN
jgi:hypothetical protein